MTKPVGVLAVQGDFEKHCEAVRRADAGADIVEVRTAEDLSEVGRLIIPGGESTTVGLLLERYGLGGAIREAASQGMPVWGTCMGMILMAREVVNRAQYNLGLLDITIERNAFGSQVNSFEDEVAIEGLSQPVLGVFIRAPVVKDLGEGVAAIGRYQERIVAVRQGNLLGTAFHPELTDDARMHRWFLSFG